MHGLCSPSHQLHASSSPLATNAHRRLSDAFNSAEDIGAKVRFFALLYTLLGIQQVVTTIAFTTTFATVAARLARRLRCEYFSALSRRPMAFYDAPGRDPASFASSVLDKAALVQTGLGDELSNLLKLAMAFLIGIAAACYYCWRLALVSLGAVPALGAVVAAASVSYARATKKASVKLQTASAIPHEAIASIRTVAAFGHEQALLDAYATECEGACRQGLALGRAKALLEAVTTPIMVRHPRLPKP